MQNKSYLVLLLLLLDFYGALSQQQNLHDSMMFFYNKSDFNKAIFFEEQMVEKNRKLTPANDSALGISLSDLGFLYNKMGLYKQAELLFDESLAVEKKFFGENHPEYAATLDNIARLYKDLGRYTEAEESYQKAISIFKTSKGEESSESAVAMNNLGNLYILTQNYSKAEELFLKTIAIRKKLSGEQNIEYATANFNLAVVYKAMRNFQEAVPIIKKTIIIYKQKYGQNNLRYASAVSSLANIYYSLGIFHEADSLAIESLQIKKNIFGVNHPEYALALNEIASLDRAEGKYDEAESLFLQSLELRKKLLGENHPDYAISLNNLGGLYYTMGNYNKAEPFYLESLSLTKKIYGEESMHYLDGLNNIANLYLSAGKHELSKTFFNNASKLEKQLLLNKLEFLSERELLAYTNFRDLSSKFPFSLLLNDSSPEITQTCFNSVLIIKGVSIANTNNLNKQLEHVTDTSVSLLWKNYKSNRSLLGKILAQPIAQRNVNTDSLSKITNQQEKELLRSSAAYRKMKEKLNTTWKDVRNNLKPQEAAIEFVSFNYLKRTLKAADTIYYAAMLVRPTDTVPVFIKLFEERQLKAALKDFAYKANVNIRGINASSVAITSNSNSLYKILWQPLERYLTNIKTVYFAPDGLLHQVAFAAIPYKKNLLLCDKYNLVQVTSTRQVPLDNKEQKPSSIALFGGINYNKQQTDTSAAVNADPYSYVYQQNRGTNVDSFTFLPNTLREVKAIKKDMDLQKKESGFAKRSKCYRSCISQPQRQCFATGYSFCHAWFYPA